MLSTSNQISFNSGCYFNSGCHKPFNVDYSVDYSLRLRLRDLEQNTLFSGQFCWTNFGEDPGTEAKNAFVNTDRCVLT